MAKKVRIVSAASEKFRPVFIASHGWFFFWFAPAVRGTFTGKNELCKESLGFNWYIGKKVLVIRIFKKGKLARLKA